MMVPTLSNGQPQILEFGATLACRRAYKRRFFGKKVAECSVDMRSWLHQSIGSHVSIRRVLYIGFLSGSTDKDKWIEG